MSLLRCYHSIRRATVVEVLMFAIAREMVTHHDSALNTALGVLSICVLFATRKFFFCKNDYDDNNAKEEAVPGTKY